MSLQECCLLWRRRWHDLVRLISTQCRLISDRVAPFVVGVKPSDVFANATHYSSGGCCSSMFFEQFDFMVDVVYHYIFLLSVCVVCTFIFMFDETRCCRTNLQIPVLGTSPLPSTVGCQRRSSGL